MRTFFGPNFHFATLVVSLVVLQAGHAAAGETAKQSGSHLGELLYLNVEAGAEYVGLQTLNLDAELVPTSVNTEDIGPAAGMGAGVRLVFVTLGGRFRYGHFKDWDLWTLGPEVGLRVPLGALEPWFSLGAGYAKVGRLQSSQVKVSGYDARLSAGLDYYFNNTFSVGGAASGEILGLTRPGVNLNQSMGSISEDLLQLDGSSVGLALMGSAVAGVHW